MAEIKGYNGDLMTTEWGALEIGMNSCELTDEKTSPLDKTVKTSQRR